MHRRLRWGASRVVSRVRRLGAYVLKPDETDKTLASIAKHVAHTDLNGRVSIVTGSTRGIGFAVAKGLAACGASIVVNGRTAHGVERAVRAMRHSGGAAVGVCADIATPAGAQHLVDTARCTFGRIDILVNNAAILGPTQRPAWETTPAEWQEVMTVNLTGAFLCARSTIDCMLRQGHPGRIINVLSGAAKTPVSGLSPYIVSKAGLEALTRTMALDADLHGITVSGVELDTYQTGMSRAVFAWDVFQLLPPPESVVPMFLYLATAPHERIHGRILAAWRFAKDPEAELTIAGPLSTVERAVFPPLRKAGQEINRFAPGTVALDRAENPCGMPGNACDLLQGFGPQADFARYPDEQYLTLRHSLSRRLHLPPECFTFASGSTELVERALRTFVQPGDEVVSNDPSWFMFDRFCAIAGAVHRKVAFKPRRSKGSFHHDLEAVAQTVGMNTRLIYLVSPSNPVGVGIGAEEFRRFLEQIPAHLPVVVDQAYIEFSTRSDALRVDQVILNTDRRVIGLRTFSKFYGLAALRVGYAFAAPDTLRLFDRLEPLFALSVAAEAAAVAALKDTDHAARTLETIQRERVRMVDRLARSGLACIPSETNFLLVTCPTSYEKVYERFAEAGVFLPKGLVMDRYLVLPIARPEQNDKHLDVLCHL